MKTSIKKTVNEEEFDLTLKRTKAIKKNKINKTRFSRKNRISVFALNKCETASRPNEYELSVSCSSGNFSTGSKLDQGRIPRIPDLKIKKVNPMPRTW